MAPPQTKNLAFWSGISYALSLLTLQKTLISVLVALSIHTGASLPKRTSLPALSRTKSFIRSPAGRLILGLSLPLSVFGLWMLPSGDLKQVAYSLLRLPFEVYESSKFYQLNRYFYFLPNDVYYGRLGYSLGWIINLVFWTLSICIALLRLAAAFRKRGAKKTVEILLFCSFAAPLILYFLYIPFPYSQYLIPPSIFVAWYLADGILFFWNLSKAFRARTAIFSLSLLAFGYLLYKTFLGVNLPKMEWTNQEALTEIQQFLNVIPPWEYVLDFEGATVYYRNPYYICCVPYSEFAQFLTRQPPPLPDSLKKTRTRLIYQGDRNIIDRLPPEDKTFIYKFYQPSNDRSMFFSKYW